MARPDTVHSLNKGRRSRNSICILEYLGYHPAIAQHASEDPSMLSDVSSCSLEHGDLEACLWSSAQSLFYLLSAATLQASFDTTAVLVRHFILFS